MRRRVAGAPGRAGALAGGRRCKAYLQIGELAESLGANVAFVLNLAVLLFQGVGQRLVARHVSFVFNEIYGFVTAGGRQRR